MPTYDPKTVEDLSARFGFIRDTFEKVLRLVDILNFINANPYLKEHLVLKGGTALNLAVMGLPRLSVDIDLDYIPNDSIDVMKAERKTLTGLLSGYLAGEGYDIDGKSRRSHSLDSFWCCYRNSAGNRDVVKIEINYSLRAHVLEPVCREAAVPELKCMVPLHIVNPLEIYAAKGNALISRAAARDLYDWCGMIDAGLFNVNFLGNGTRLL